MHLSKTMAEIHRAVSMVSIRLATNSALLVKNNPWPSKMFIQRNNNSNYYISNKTKEDKSIGVHSNSSKQNHLSQVQIYSRPEANSNFRNNKSDKYHSKIQVAPGDKAPN